MIRPLLVPKITFEVPKLTRRVIPDICHTCGTHPTECQSCGDYQCKCLVPWLLVSEEEKTWGKRPARIIPRVHYDKKGKAYEMRFSDGYTHSAYAAPDEDIRWLIEGTI